MSSLVRGGGCNRPTVTCILSYYFLYSFFSLFSSFSSRRLSPRFCIVFSIAFPFRFPSKESLFSFSLFPTNRPRWQRTAVFDQPRCVLSLSPGQRKQTNETNRERHTTHTHVFDSIVLCVVLTKSSINLVVCCRCHQLFTLSRPNRRNIQSSRQLSNR